MLDKNKVFDQLNKLVPEFYLSFSQEIEIAISCFRWAMDNQTNLIEILSTQEINLIKNLSNSFEIADINLPYNIIAIDGSQIYSDRHQSLSCFLINIGITHLYYSADNSFAKITSIPSVHSYNHTSLEADYFDESFVNNKRNEMELYACFEHIEKKINSDSLYLFDGSYTLSHLDPFKSESDRISVLNMLKVYEELSQLNILHCNYISFPKNKELVNILKKLINAQIIPNLPKANLIRISDFDILSLILQAFNRTEVIESDTAVTKFYSLKIKPNFIYLHTGNEIARIEFPKWIANDIRLLNRICSIILDQCKKGYGYPIALSEAHEAAVVKSSDREFFYNLLQNISLKQGKSINLSQKNRRKRSPII